MNLSFHNCLFTFTTWWLKDFLEGSSNTKSQRHSCSLSVLRASQRFMLCQFHAGRLICSFLSLYCLSSNNVHLFDLNDICFNLSFPVRSYELNELSRELKLFVSIDLIFRLFSKWQLLQMTKKRDEISTTFYHAAVFNRTANSSIIYLLLVYYIYYIHWAFTPVSGEWLYLRLNGSNLFNTPALSSVLCLFLVSFLISNSYSLCASLFRIAVSASIKIGTLNTLIFNYFSSLARFK